jgi:hypothetical protein
MEKINLDCKRSNYSFSCNNDLEFLLYLLRLVNFGRKESINLCIVEYKPFRHTKQVESGKKIYQVESVETHEVIENLFVQTTPDVTKRFTYVVYDLQND